MDAPKFPSVFTFVRLPVAAAGGEAQMTKHDSFLVASYFQCVCVCALPLIISPCVGKEGERGMKPQSSSSLSGPAPVKNDLWGACAVECSGAKPSGAWLRLVVKQYQTDYEWRGIFLPVY